MTTKNNGVHKKGVQDAIDLLGSQQALADAINKNSGENIKQAHIHKWLHLVKKLPIERAFQIEKATYGLVTKELLRPDFFTN
jgi:DNA-binding transcriptional regulator YdaS (Cro superfamily)